MSEFETIIIGAGASGLAAGAALAGEGKSFVILEARDRMGGRVHTVRDEHWPLPMEFGAEFIHGRPTESWEIVHAAGVRAYDVANEHWFSRKGKPVKDSCEWPAVEKIMQRLTRVGKADSNFVDFLRKECAGFSAGAKAMAKAFVEGLDAADAKLVSCRSLLASDKDGEKFDADVPFRMVDGYDRLLQAMARPIPKESIRLKTIVRAIEWSPGKVIVETVDGDRIEAGRVLITLPIGVLLASAGETGAVRFDPPLPGKMRQAIDQMRMGPVVKVLLRFKSAFWEEGRWRDFSFLHSPGDVFPTWWTMLPCRLPLLTGWAGGPAAAALSNRPAMEVLLAALGTLAPLLGVKESKLHAELAAWHISDWQADPFARGAYAYAMVGGANAAKRLSQPIEQTLFFAGEATHPGYAGTVAAAIASGRRAVEQMLRS
jgi:monoamine oxidase